ncbi:MAG: membrane dipeptidase [Myxococcales bacterium]|nr:membrane dipeptidase [Myxococcales bacterium]
MRRGRQIGQVVTATTLALGLLGSAEAKAEKSADQVCSELAKKAQRTLWSGVREAGDELFCRKSWVPGRADELLACGAWTQANLFGNKVKGAWNRFFSKADAEWATWGPRGIASEWEEGTIRGGFKRTFFGAGLATFTSTFEVEKEGGQAAAHITVCELDYDGKVIGKHRRDFANGSGGKGTKVSVSITHKNNAIVGLVVDTPASVNSFEYRARQLSAPDRVNLPAVKGIADLHVHQFMNLAFAGRMYWGQHAGPKSQALAKEEINISGSGLNLNDPVQLVEQLRTLTVGIDANMLLKAFSPATTDEGTFTYGGGGAPSWKEWPHHADRSHQAVHIDWLQAAHERGKKEGSNLNLMVVSLVNNNILCSVLKVLDKYGNVPIRDSKGKIKGWESAAWGCSDQENVTRQLAALHQLEKDYPWYRVAMSPWHARQIIADGDLAVVVSMETDKPLSGAGNNYGDWERQLDSYRALGLSTMQIVHESDSIFAGAAPHRDMMKALQAIHNPLQAISNLVDGEPPFELDSKGYNKLGLTAAGNRLVDAMVKRNMPIDIAHMSERARKALFARVPKGWGLYDSHTKFKRLMEPAKGAKNHGTHVLEREKEFLIMESILPDYVKHKVLVGLRTASVDVYDAPKSKVANDCPGSAKSFAQLVQYANDSGLDFAFGTDFNTGVSQLGPRFGGDDRRCFAALPIIDAKTRTTRPVGPAGPLPPRASSVKPIDGTNYYYDGLAHIGWLPELTEDLIQLGTPGATRLRSSAEAYLVMWERAFPVKVASAPASEPAPVSNLALGATCRKNEDCASGNCTGALGAYGVCACKEDAQCGAGKWCDAGVDLTKNTCKALKNDNEACAAVGGGHQCKSGKCNLGRCYTPSSVAMGGTCYVDGACREGKCSSVDGTKGTCVCKEDSDCGAGKWCDGGLDLKKNSCKAKLDKGEVCGTAGEIGVGHRCKSGKCKVSGISTKLKCQ